MAVGLSVTRDETGGGRLNGINNDDLTEESCSALATVLISSSLRELDLSNNNLKNSGVKKLCEALENPLCKLETLSLSSCSVTEEGYSALTSALKTNRESHLKKLDFSGNDPGDEGIELITSVFMSSNKTLRLLNSDAAEKACSLLHILNKNPLLQRELDLSQIKPEQISVNQLSALLEDPLCRLQKLTLYEGGSITEKDCAAVISALIINPSHLRELDLNENKLDQSALKKLCDLLKNLCCKLEKLRIKNCSIKEKGCAHLASALCSNPTHISVLDLSKNKLGDSGMKQLCKLVKNQECKLQELLINDDDLTEESCSALATVLTSSSLRELDLSNNNLQNSGVKKLCEALENPLCKLETLSLSSCSVTEEGYAALASALNENHKSHLKKLDFSGNDPGDKGVEQITSALMNSKKTLRLLKRDAAEEACTRLLHILNKNPLLQMEFDLSQIKPEQISVNQLSALLEDPHCRLQKLTLYESGSITEEHCADVISALIINPSHLRELDLNENKLDYSALLKLCDLLENPCCKLEKLRLKNCSVEEEGCAALTSVLTSNFSHLRELDLRGNNLAKSAVQLSEIMKKSGCNLRLDKSISTVLSFTEWLTRN